MRRALPFVKLICPGRLQRTGGDPMSVALEPEGAIVLSVRKTRRDMHLSIGLAVVGAILVVGAAGAEQSALRSGSVSGGLIVAALAYVGEIFVFVGLIFTGVNWWLLRRREGGPRGPPTGTPRYGASPLGATGPAPAPRTHVGCTNCGRVWPVGQYSTCPSCHAPLAG